MLNSLRLTRDAVALEAGFVQNVQELIRNVFPSMRADIASFFGQFSNEAPAIQLTSAQNEFIKEISKHSFSDLTALGAYVPEGLDVPYADYLKVLEAAGDHAFETMPKVLADYSLYLSMLINNNDQKRDTKSFVQALREFEKKRTEHNIALGRCFKKGSTRTDVTIGHVVNRNSDWTNVFGFANKLMKDANSVDRRALNKKIAEISQLLDVIQKKVEREDFVGASPETVENLAEYTYSVASELEFFAATYYKALAITTAINRTVEHFKNVFEK